jgi:predicted ATPase
MLPAAPAGRRAARRIATTSHPGHEPGIAPLSAEREYEVPPLGVPDLARLPSATSLAQYEAVALFIDRATAARSDFAVTNANAPAIAEICSRLAGLPLAIELAATRVELLSPEAILDRLARRLPALAPRPADVPQRQRTLRTAIDWSYELLERYP